MIRGEYWIDDGCGAQYADGDIGDLNHEMIAFWSGIGLDSEEYGEWVNPNGFDWDALANKYLEEATPPDGIEFSDMDIGVIKSLSKDEWAAFGADNGIDPNIINAYADKPEDREVALGYQMMIDAGANRKFIDWWETSGTQDAREYGLEHLGWMRVKGDNYETWNFDDNALDCIQNFIGNSEDVNYEDGMFDEGGEYEDESAFIEERSTGKTWDIPYKTIMEAKSAAGLKRYMEGIGKYR